MKRIFLPIALLLVGWQQLRSQSPAALRTVDRVRIAEAFRLAEEIGSSVWKQWDQAPFAILLVTPDSEFLIRHPSPTDDFSLLGYDSLLQTMVFHRSRVYQPHMLATFPAVGVVPTIVIGQAENTRVRRSTLWVITLLHEHFHQLQYSRPRYYQRLADLDLSRGDESGMWVLNFPFPYDSSTVADLFDRLTRSLSETLLADERDLQPRLKSYLALRDSLRILVGDDAFRYFSFQTWQEGISLYTELKVAEAAKHYVPGEDFQALHDFIPFADEILKIRSSILNPLKNIALKESRRVVFYPIGAAEGLLLDRVNPEWRDRYHDVPLSLAPFFEEVRPE